MYALSQRTGQDPLVGAGARGQQLVPAVAGDLVVVPAGAEPTTIAQPDDVVDGYALR